MCIAPLLWLFGVDLKLEYNNARCTLRAVLILTVHGVTSCRFQRPIYRTNYKCVRGR